MNNDDAILDRFLTEITEFIDTDALASMNRRDAQAILDAIPADLHQFHAALRDAFRDNIDCDDDAEPLV